MPLARQPLVGERGGRMVCEAGVRDVGGNGEHPPRRRGATATAAARAGASVPLVPHSTLSLWNRVNVRPALGVGVGVVHQARMYAAIDNTVRLPAFTRVDGALYLRLVRGLRMQANVENLLNTRYFATSHGNNNIMPGATRTVRLSIGVGQ